MKRKYIARILSIFLILGVLFSLLSGCQSSSSSTSPSASTLESSAPSEAPITSEPTQPASPTAEAKTEITRKLTVHFIDVGQADSIFIELPNDECMLIDAGNAEDGDNVVSYIKNLGYDTIDYLVATHPHEDHIGGMTSVVENFNIGAIYMPKAQTNTKTYENLLLAIQNKGLSINTAKAGVSIIGIDGLKADILAPNSDSYEDLNNYSAVIKLTFKNNSFLFMGDAETLSENEITADLKADVLKVGHHGSDSSTGETFLGKVAPKYAVISVGESNSYGHPAAPTIEKLDNAGAAVYRTDKDGTVVFKSDGTNIAVNKSPVKITSAPVIATIQPTVAPTPVPTPAPTQSEKKEVTVYITKTGSKYHRDGCQYLSKSKIAISLDDAISQGYEPCSKCNPPTK